MDHHEWNLYLKTYETISAHLPKPDVIVYLKTSIDTLMKRIKHRGRSYEQSIPKDYIALLDRLNTLWIESTDIPIIVIDTDERDIVNKERDREYIIITLRHELARYAR